MKPYLCAYVLVAIKVRFNNSTYRVSESDGVVQPVVLFTNPSSTDITVHIMSTNNKIPTGKVNHIMQLHHMMSTTGMSYNPGSYEILFTAGQTNASFNISIFEDGIRDDNEMFTLTINSKMLPDRVSTGNPSTSTVIIADTTGEKLSTNVYFIEYFSYSGHHVIPDFI